MTLQAPLRRETVRYTRSATGAEVICFNIQLVPGREGNVVNALASELEQRK